TKDVIVVERQLVIDLYPTRMGNLYLYVGIPLLGEACLQKRLSCSPVIRYLGNPGLYRFRLDISKAGFDHPAEKHVNLGSPVGCFPPFRPGRVGDSQPTSDTHLGIPVAQALVVLVDHGWGDATAVLPVLLPQAGIHLSTDPCRGDDDGLGYLIQVPLTWKSYGLGVARYEIHRSVASNLREGVVALESKGVHCGWYTGCTAVTGRLRIQGPRGKVRSTRCDS